MKNIVYVSEKAFAACAKVAKEEGLSEEGRKKLENYTSVLVSEGEELAGEDCPKSFADYVLWLRNYAEYNCAK